MVGAGGERDVACVPLPPAQHSETLFATGAYLLCSRSRPNPECAWPSRWHMVRPNPHILYGHASLVGSKVQLSALFDTAAHGPTSDSVLTGAVCIACRTSSPGVTCCSPAPSQTSWPSAASWRRRASSARPSRTTSPSAARALHSPVTLCFCLIFGRGRGCGRQTFAPRLDADTPPRLHFSTHVMARAEIRRVPRRMQCLMFPCHRRHRSGQSV